MTSKGAVLAMTRALAKELARDNVLVNTVAPGLTMGDGVLDNPVQLEQLRDVSVNARVPRELLGHSSIRYARPEDADKLKSQRYTVLVDEPLGLPVAR